ncbi:glycine zipper 2TM domain-containing protein [Thalassotalea euphylliae]|uniref:glycine zipper 2TM domain-containing protein n=1 Tax=Thalassotalea euphylliae TaxID=1655234 RepID=UPI0036333BA6
MKLVPLFFLCLITGFMTHSTAADYERNKAVPVQQVLFGHVTSVRQITEREIIEDRANGWELFGGALIGGVLGNQIGDGSGRDIATVLGSIIGAAVVDKKGRKSEVRELHLVELMIRTEQGDDYMVVQDYDRRMLFSRGDDVRMVYLANGTVRIDKQY